jgi:hypothetical protein
MSRAMLAVARPLVQTSAALLKFDRATIGRERMSASMPDADFPAVDYDLIIHDGEILTVFRLRRRRSPGPVAARRLCGPRRCGARSAILAHGSRSSEIDQVVTVEKREVVLNGRTGSWGALRGGDGSCHRRCRFRVLQRSILGTANGEYRHCLGVRSFLREILSASMTLSLATSRSPLADSFIDAARDSAILIRGVVIPDNRRRSPDGDALP